MWFVGPAYQKDVSEQTSADAEEILLKIPEDALLDRSKTL